MKKISILIVVLAVILSLGLMSCSSTGGGWFYANGDSGSKVTFGYTVQQTDGFAAQGQFQLVDHSFTPPRIIHGTFEGMLGQAAGGDCTLTAGGDDPVSSGDYDFYLTATDNGEPGTSDKINVTIKIPGPDIHYNATLDGGNIQSHSN